MMKFIISLLILTFISGCSGKVITVKKPQFNTNGEIDGILFYGYKKDVKEIVMDRIRHKKTGGISHSMYAKHSSASYCSPQVQEQTIFVPNYDSPYSVKYEPGLFETNTFAAVLEKGMLKSVNSQSTPGIKTAVESLQGLVTIREDILDGIREAEDNQASITLNNIRGISPVTTPIKCSTNK